MWVCQSQSEEMVTEPAAHMNEPVSMDTDRIEIFFHWVPLLLLTTMISIVTLFGVVQLSTLRSILWISIKIFF